MVLATVTVVPLVASASLAWTRQPRLTFRVGPRNGFDQHTGHRGVGGVVGANAGWRRVGRRSDISQFMQAPAAVPPALGRICDRATHGRPSHARHGRDRRRLRCLR